MPTCKNIPYSQSALFRQRKETTAADKKTAAQKAAEAEKRQEEERAQKKRSDTSNPFRSTPKPASKLRLDDVVADFVTEARPTGEVADEEEEAKLERQQKLASVVANFAKRKEAGLVDERPPLKMPKLLQMENEARDKLQAIREAHQQPLPNALPIQVIMKQAGAVAKSASRARANQAEEQPHPIVEVKPMMTPAEEMSAEEKRKMMASILKKVSAMPGSQSDVQLLTQQLHDMGGAKAPEANPYDERSLQEIAEEEHRREKQEEAQKQLRELGQSHLMEGSPLFFASTESPQEGSLAGVAPQEAAEAPQALMQGAGEEPGAAAMPSSVDFFSNCPPEILAEMQKQQDVQQQAMSGLMPSFPGAFSDPLADPFQAAQDPAMAAMLMNFGGGDAAALADDPTLTAIVSSQLYHVATAQEGNQQQLNLPPWSPLLQVNAPEAEGGMQKLLKLRQEQEAAKAKQQLLVAASQQARAAAQKEEVEEEDDTSSPFGPGWSKTQHWPGDWCCPSCTSLQFASRDTCSWCGIPKSMGLPPEASQHGKWRRTDTTWKADASGWQEG